MFRKWRRSSAAWAMGLVLAAIQVAGDPVPVDVTKAEPLEAALADHGAMRAGAPKGPVVFTTVAAGGRAAWVVPLPVPQLIADHPVVALRYRARNVASNRQFAVMLMSAGEQNALGAVRGDQIKSDGAEHTLRVDTRRRHVVGLWPLYVWDLPADRIVLTLAATDAGPAELEVLGLSLDTATEVDRQHAAAVAKTGSVTVTVIDAETNQPMADAPVEMIMDCDRLFDFARTDAAGRVTFLMPTFTPGANVMLFAEPAGHARSTVMFGSSGRDGVVVPEETTIRVGAGKTVRGLVRDEDGKPVAHERVGVEFEAIAADASPPSSYDLACYTDEQGQWELKCIPTNAAALTLSVNDDGRYVRTREQFSIGDGPVELTLKRGTVAARARVLDEHGYPLYRAAARMPASPDEVYSDLHGWCRWQAEGPTTAAAVVGKPEFAAAQATVAVSATEPPTEVRLAAGKELTGHVVDADGKPVAKAKVYVRSWQGITDGWPNWFLPGSITTKEDGAFTFRHLPDDEVKLRASAAGFSTVSDVSARPDGTDHVITLNVNGAAGR